MDYQQLFDKYYPDENEQRRILLTHSRLVADKALAIARQHPEMLLDMPFIEEAAMLHDIGIIRCDPRMRCSQHLLLWFQALSLPWYHRSRDVACRRLSASCVGM